MNSLTKNNKKPKWYDNKTLLEKVKEKLLLLNDNKLNQEIIKNTIKINNIEIKNALIYEITY